MTAFSIPTSTAYGWLMLAGICVSILFWSRLAKRDERLVFIYVAALAGAFPGAKLVYLGAEGWLHWQDADRWVQLATGKSIIGGLLGGYAGVEIAKRLLGYTNATGDWFAVITPVTIMLGRIGCLLHGCCLGRVCAAAWFTVNDARKLYPRNDPCGKAGRNCGTKAAPYLGFARRATPPWSRSSRRRHCSAQPAMPHPQSPWRAPSARQAGTPSAACRQRA